MQPLDVSVFGPLKSCWRKVLKEHQLATCAAIVTKEDFPMLLSRLWDLSFLPQHLRSGFSKCGLCPFNREAIPAHKLSKADPHKISSASEQHPGEGQDGVNTSSSSEADKEAHGQGTEVVVNLTGECTINTVVTPIRLHLKGYFTHILQKNKEGRKRAVNKQKHKPQFYGEALTMDDFYEKVVEAEQKKQEEEAGRRKEERRKEERKEERAIENQGATWEEGGCKEVHSSNS